MPYRKNGYKVDVLLNEEGILHLKSNFMFRSGKSKVCQEFIKRTFVVTEVNNVTIDPNERTATIEYSNHCNNEKSVLRKIVKALTEDRKVFEGYPYMNAEITGLDGTKATILRYGDTLSTWQIKHELPGRIRFINPILYRKKVLCQNIERELLNSAGIERYSTNFLTSSVLIVYDETKIGKNHIIQILDSALAKSSSRKKSPLKFDMPLNTISLGVAAAGRYVAPWLKPVSTGLVVYTAMPSFIGAVKAIKDKKIGVDILDTIIVSVCLLSGNVFAAAIMNWCLSLGRTILDKTEEDSKKLLAEVFAKQPRFVWLYKDGLEIEIALSEVKTDDTIVVNTGEIVPIDGEVVDGTAMIDQHILTGESAPVEKAKGDTVYACTVLLAGKIFVKVSQTGDQTTSAKIKNILTKTAGYKIKSQSRGEELADKAVIPTLGISSLGYAVSGFDASLAIINCDFGTGIRIAAPLGLLSTLAICATDGILVKQGKALEHLPEIDTFLFDKTGTLTKGVPEVSDIIPANGMPEEMILMYAAVAEEKFTHPIALAILEKSKGLNITLPKRDDSKYHVGFGITVCVDRKIVKVGSARFMQMEGIPIPYKILTEMDLNQKLGGTMVMVAIDGALCGGIQFNTSHRPEAFNVINGLRERGVKEIVLISGDHEHPTKKLAESLGADRYFAEVLPQDKGNYVKHLQREKKKVAFVGDGINDSIALKRADVSISLRGASSIATDTAQIVFMDDSLKKLNNLMDHSINLQKNVDQSWSMIAVSNIICITGAVFGVFGLTASLIMNNGINFFATLNGVRPLWKVYEQDFERETAHGVIKTC